MTYKNKIKLRAGLAVCYFVIGILLIILQNRAGDASDFFSGFGLALAAIGASKLLHNLRYLRDPDKLLAIQTAETDERNVMLYTKSRSMTYVIFTLLCAVMILITRFLGHIAASQTIAYMLCAQIAINCICCYILRRKY